MLKSLLRFEESVAHFEGRLLTVIVTVMLALAVYNVFYRNALVPLQASILTPDEEAAAPESSKSEQPPPTEDDSDEASSAESADETGFGGGFDDESTDGFGGGFDDDSTGDAEGFGGGFGDQSQEESREESPEQPAEESDETEGFGGGFDDTPEEPADGEKEPDDGTSGFGGDFEEPDSDEANGFGGGFEDDSEGFGGGFEDEGESTATAEEPESNPVEAVALEHQLSGFEQFVVDFVDALKIEWIDVLLRQLVLFVGFLGGMLATRRRKHITIDALTKVIPEKSLPYVHAFTSGLSAVVCIFLAVSGWELVKISLEYPKELMSWADESTFQMVFPVGFGLLTFHFVLRMMVSIAEVITGEDADAALRGEA